MRKPLGTGEPASVSVDPGTRPELLDDLRKGERIAFVRFYELFRLPVYNFVLHLVGNGEDATAVTREVFIRAYRQLLLRDGAVDVRPLVYKVAVDTCHKHGVGASGDDAVTEMVDDRAAQAGGWEDGPLARRFEQALQTLDYPQRAALLLNDVLALPHVETAAVLGLSQEATAALLFRASERFRHAFEEPPVARADWTCRLAETAAASAVGRRCLTVDEERKLREHILYCRQCSRTTGTWAAGAIGLGQFVRDAPLPPSLEVVPVFGTASSWGGAAGEAEAKAVGAGGIVTIVAALASVGRALTSKAVAYALAAACAAAFLGLAVSQQEWQPQQQPVSSGHSASATTRRAGRTAAARTSVKVAGGSSGRVSEPTRNTRVAVGSPVAGTPDAQDLGTPALALLSPLASDRRQIGSPPTLSDAAASGGGAAVDSAAARGHHKAGKEDHARARGDSGLRHADRVRTHVSSGNGWHAKADKPSHGARQRPHPHRTKTRDKQKA